MKIRRILKNRDTWGVRVCTYIFLAAALWYTHLNAGSKCCGIKKSLGGACMVVYIGVCCVQCIVIWVVQKLRSLYIDSA